MCLKSTCNIIFLESTCNIIYLKSTYTIICSRPSSGPELPRGESTAAAAGAAADAAMKAERLSWLPNP